MLREVSSIRRLRVPNIVPFSNSTSRMQHVEDELEEEAYQDQRWRGFRCAERNYQDWQRERALNLQRPSQVFCTDTHFKLGESEGLEGNSPISSLRDRVVSSWLRGAFQRRWKLACEAC